MSKIAHVLVHKKNRYVQFLSVGMSCARLPARLSCADFNIVFSNEFFKLFWSFFCFVQSLGYVGVIPNIYTKKMNRNAKTISSTSGNVFTVIYYGYDMLN